jgi:hypothetical protein
MSHPYAPAVASCSAHSFDTTRWHFQRVLRIGNGPSVTARSMPCLEKPRGTQRESRGPPFATWSRMRFILFTAGLVACSATPDTGPDASANDAAPTMDTSTVDANSTLDAGDVTTEDAAAHLPTGPSGSWSLIFDDEFSGTALDPTKWNSGWYTSGVNASSAPVSSGELEYYSPGAIVFPGDGAVHLRLSASASNTYGKAYQSGMIQSSNLFTFDPTKNTTALEARLRVPGPQASAAGTGRRSGSSRTKTHKAARASGHPRSTSSSSSATQTPPSPTFIRRAATSTIPRQTRQAPTCRLHSTSTRSRSRQLRSPSTSMAPRAGRTRTPRTSRRCSTIHRSTCSSVSSSGALAAEQPTVRPRSRTTW